MRDPFNDILPSEQKRCRYCRGCVYFAKCHHYGSCDYFLRTGRKRPTKPGQPDCPVRKYQPGYKLPKDHEEFCRQVDAETENRQQATSETLNAGYVWNGEILPSEIKPVVKSGAAPRKRGRPPSWDTEYGFRLYLHGYYFFEIGEVLNVDPDTVAKYASDNFWAGQFPPGVKRHRHDIEQAKQEYKRYIERISGIKKEDP